MVPVPPRPPISTCAVSIWFSRDAERLLCIDLQSYIGDAHPWVLVSTGSPGTSPQQIVRDDLKVLRESWIFHFWGITTPNYHAVQGSTVSSLGVSHNILSERSQKQNVFYSYIYGKARNSLNWSMVRGIGCGDLCLLIF